MRFSVVVDSCCDLTALMRSSGNFKVVPLTIQIGGQTFTDRDGLLQQELLSAMKSCPDAPRTSCPSPADYLDAFRSTEGDIYVVTLSALLSGSHNAARQAASLLREEQPDRSIYIFNSCSASAGEVLLALKLHEWAEAGLPFPEVVRRGDRFIAEMNTLFVLEDLGNLIKNGRLTGIQAALTSALHVKLLLGATPEGEICRRGQALSVKQAMSRLVQLISADNSHMGKTLCIAHCNCRARAESLRILALKHCDFQDVLICTTHGISTVYANNGGLICAY